jgi:hypothetical protein
MLCIETLTVVFTPYQPPTANNYFPQVSVANHNCEIPLKS